MPPEQISIFCSFFIRASYVDVMDRRVSSGVPDMEA